MFVPPKYCWKQYCTVFLVSQDIVLENVRKKAWFVSSQTELVSGVKSFCQKEQRGGGLGNPNRRA